VRALDGAQACDQLLSRAGQVWAGPGGEPLPAPATVRLEPVVPHEKVVAGAVGRGPDRMFAESAATVAARLSATCAALAELEGQLTTCAHVQDGLEVLRSLPEIDALLPPPH
jgi:hypothetical protein